MLKLLVLISLAVVAACTGSPTDPAPESASKPADFDLGGQCFAVHTTGEVADDFILPRLIQLTQRPAPNFVDPGRFAVWEPSGEPRAPISWWRPTGDSSIELVLGGGYTGYTFSLERAGDAWVGQGKYCSDMGLEPPPDELAVRLTRQNCR